MDMTAWYKTASLRAEKAWGDVRALLNREYTDRGLAFLFLITLLVGFLTKSLVHDSLTIGFDDYRLNKSDRLLDLNALQTALLESGGTLSVSGQETPKGQSCADSPNIE